MEIHRCSARLTFAIRKGRAALCGRAGKARQGYVRADEPKRLAGLDLLRGVAALAVLLLHGPWPAGVQTPLPRGYLAVDLFFVLSGFVLADAYQHRLGTAAQFGQYCRARMIRLYPLYCAATLLSAVTILAAMTFGTSIRPGAISGKLLESTATALLFLPTPTQWSVVPAVFFPLVFVAWSLFWELLVNLLYGLVSVHLRPKLFALLIGVGLAGVIVALHSYGSAADLGVVWDGAWAGAARALFSFFTGVALFRVRQAYRAPRVPVLRCRRASADGFTSSSVSCCFSRCLFGSVQRHQWGRASARAVCSQAIFPTRSICSRHLSP
jgi:peptidoglycan/LPS O-acetylase OafA/YrhL